MPGEAELELGDVPAARSRPRAGARRARPARARRTPAACAGRRCHRARVRRPSGTRRAPRGFRARASRRPARRTRRPRATRPARRPRRVCRRQPNAPVAGSATTARIVKTRAPSSPHLDLSIGRDAESLEHPHSDGRKSADDNERRADERDVCQESLQRESNVLHPREAGCEGFVRAAGLHVAAGKGLVYARPLGRAGPDRRRALEPYRRCLSGRRDTE